MRYEKLLPAGETKSIWAPRDTEINGRIESDIGLVVIFEGKPAICDTTRFAKERVKWEEQMGKIERGDQEAFDKRVEEVDRIICKFIENHEDYRNGRIFPAKSFKQRLIDQKQMVCLYCDDEKPYVAGNAQALFDHQMEEHKQDLLSGMGERQKKSKPENQEKKDDPFYRDEKGHITGHKVLEAEV